MGKTPGGGAEGGGAPPGTPAAAAVKPETAKTPKTPETAKTPKTPVGVVVVDSQQEASGSLEMHKLLRQPRYFDDDFDGTALRCFRCGGTGHMSRDCRNEVRQKPCILCAQFRHVRSECPQALCFKCKRPGHQSRDCPNAGGRQQSRGDSKACLRCGSKSCACANRSDYVRADGGCTTKYNHADLALVQCHVCYAHGHLICKQTPKSVPKSSCYNCGDSKHTGPDCWKEVPAAIRGEQADVAREESAAYWQAAQGHRDFGSYGMAPMEYGDDQSGRQVWYGSQENSRGRSTYEQGRYAWEQKMGYHGGGGGSESRHQGRDHHERERSGKRRDRDDRDSRGGSTGKHTRFF